LKEEARNWDCECFLVAMAERDIKKAAHVGGMTDVDLAELGQGQSALDIQLLRDWRASEKAKRKKGQVGVSPTRALGGVGGEKAEGNRLLTYLYFSITKLKRQKPRGKDAKAPESAEMPENPTDDEE